MTDRQRESPLRACVGYLYEYINMLLHGVATYYTEAGIITSVMVVMLEWRHGMGWDVNSKTVAL